MRRMKFTEENRCFRQDVARSPSCICIVDQISSTTGELLTSVEHCIQAVGRVEGRGALCKLQCFASIIKLMQIKNEVELAFPWKEDDYSGKERHEKTIMRYYSDNLI